MKKRAFEIIGFIVICSLMLGYLSLLLNRKYSVNEYRLFYEKSEDYDVLFFGLSVVHYAISPMQLWKKYGITSYNMGNDSERLAMTYYTILNSLDYANPEMIVVDLTAMSWAGSKRDYTLKDHNFLDAVPLSLNKIKTVREMFEKDEVIEYLFPFTLYHSRWNGLSAEDFDFNYRSPMYGVQFQAGILDIPEPTREMYDQSRYGEVYAEVENIQKIIDLCNQRNIKVVFVYLPGGSRGGDQKLRKFCADYLATQRVAYYDMLDVEYIDWYRDFMDPAHVNFFGAEKITNDLGRILSREYNIGDHGDDLYFESWDKDYLKYEQLVHEYLRCNLDMYNQAKDVE